MNDFAPEMFFLLDAFPHKALFQDIEYVWEAIGKIASYLQNFPLGQIEVEIPEGAYLQDEHLISIGKGAIIEPGAYIKGPCIIGEGCTIRQGAYLRGNVIMGPKSLIGHASEIKNSILLNHAYAPHFAYVGDSILGNDVNLGAGTICSNFRLDKKEIFIQYGEKKIATHLKKLGAILGDRTQLGCNTVTNPGTLTFKGVYSYPGVHFSGVIPENALVKAASSFIVKQPSNF